MDLTHPSSLFPAFSNSSSSENDKDKECKTENEPQVKDLWLVNRSFPSEDAEEIHKYGGHTGDSFKRRFLETDDIKIPKGATTSMKILSEKTVCPKKKRKKDKKKKRLIDKKEPSLHESKHDVGKVFLEQIYNLKPEHAYRLDRNADQNNFIYQAIYKGNIASYRRIRHFVLGEKRELMSSSKPRKTFRYFQKLLPLKDSCQFCCKTSNFEEETRKSFIEVENSCDGKVEKCVNDPLGVYDKGTLNYLDETGFPAKNSNQFTVLSTSSQAQAFSEQAILNQHLSKNPHDVDAWMKLVKIQELASLIDEDCKGGKLSQTKIREIKLSILDRAVEKNTSSLPLRLMQLELAESMWPYAKLKSKWQQFVFVYANNGLIQRHFLQFMRSIFSEFSVMSSFREYTKSLKKLESILSGQLLSHPPLSSTSPGRMAIFFELCWLLWLCGHSERAVAICQAQIELSLFTPLLVHQSHLDKLDLLEAFWGSMSPRIGEKCGVGWGKWVENKGNVQQWSNFSRDQEEEREEMLLKESKQELHKHWLTLEQDRVSHQWLPWRPGEGETEEDCEDMDRIVAFSSIRNLLTEKLSDSDIVSVIIFLVDLLTNNCMKVPHQHSSSEFSIYERSSILSSPHQLGSDISFTWSPSLQGVDNFCENLLLACSSKFVNAEHRLQLNIRLAQLYIDQFRRGFVGVKEARAHLKKILSEYRSDPGMWCIFVEFEGECKRPVHVQNVIDTCLAAQSSVLNNPDTLCRTACLKLIRLGLRSDDWAADKILTWFSKTDLLMSNLHVQKFLKNFIEQWKPSRAHVQVWCAHGYFLGCDLQHACWILARLVLPAGGAEAAEHVYELARKSLHNHRDSQVEMVDHIDEVLIVDHVQILEDYIHSYKLPRRILRNQLVKALSLAPNSHHLAWILARLNGHAHLAAQLWRSIASHQSSSPTVPLVALLSEIKRKLDVSNGICSSQSMFRSQFEKLLQKREFSHNVLIWRLYLHVEISFKQSKAARAVLYRAVDACPWARDIYYDGISYFPDVFNEMLSLAAEKELRVRTPLEEVKLLLKHIHDGGDADGEESQENNSENGERNADSDADDKKRDGDADDKRDGDADNKRDGDADDKKRDGDADDKKRDGDADDKKRDGDADDKKRDGDADDKKRDDDADDKKRDGDADDKKRDGADDKKRDGDADDKRDGDADDKKRDGNADDKRDGDTDDKKRDGDNDDKKRDGDTDDKKRDGDTCDKKRDGDTDDKKRDGDTCDKKRDGDTCDKKRGSEADKKKRP